MAHKTWWLKRCRYCGGELVTTQRHSRDHGNKFYKSQCHNTWNRRVAAGSLDPIADDKSDNDFCQAISEAEAIAILTRQGVLAQSEPAPIEAAAPVSEDILTLIEERVASGVAAGIARARDENVAPSNIDAVLASYIERLESLLGQQGGAKPLGGLKPVSLPKPAELDDDLFEVKTAKSDTSGGQNLLNQLLEVSKSSVKKPKKKGKPNTIKAIKTDFAITQMPLDDLPPLDLIN